MNKNNNLGNRIKQYENVSRIYLTRRTPVIIRLDGCHFHTFTKGFDKPFDELLCKSMQTAMKTLCENIQNCVLGYTQSDEITLVLCDYKKLTTDAWFSNNVQKMASVSASICTAAFNRAFSENISELIGTNDKNATAYLNCYMAKEHTAVFDARVFNIPKEEVCNSLIWRQQDATKNSIQSLGRKYFSHEQLNDKNESDIQDMLMLEKNVNWNNTPAKFKRGSCCIRTEDGWMIDNDIPIFTKDRNYIENRIVFDEE